jgi:hypothetical protein
VRRASGILVQQADPGGSSCPAASSHFILAITPAFDFSVIESRPLGCPCQGVKPEQERSSLAVLSFDFMHLLTALPAAIINRHEGISRL